MNGGVVVQHYIYLYLITKCDHSYPDNGIPRERSLSTHVARVGGPQIWSGHSAKRKTASRLWESNTVQPAA
jgi:hypothetical protein